MGNWWRWRIVKILKDILRWARHEGYAGEEKNILTVFAALTTRMKFGIASTSGAGKTKLLDTMFELVDSSWIKKIGLSSDTAAFYDQWENIKFLYIPELQKAIGESKLSLVEMMKDLGEGKDSKRLVTKADRTGVETKTIPKDIGVVYTRAYENMHYGKGGTDTELARRFPEINLDITPKHVHEIEKLNAEWEFLPERFSEFTEEEVFSLQERIRRIIVADSRELLPIANPFATYLVETLPSYGTTSPSYKIQYHKFAKAFAKLRIGTDAVSPYSMKVKDKNVGRYLMTIQDVRVNHFIYGQTCARNILGVPYLGDKILQMYERPEFGGTLNTSQQDILQYSVKQETRKWATVDDVVRGLSEIDIKVPYDFVRYVMTVMAEHSHHLEVKKRSSDTRSWVFYRVQTFEEVEKIDWVNCWRHGRDKIKESTDDESYERWVSSQIDSRTGDMLFDNPITGNVSVIISKEDIW